MKKGSGPDYYRELPNHVLFSISIARRGALPLGSMTLVAVLVALAASVPASSQQVRGRDSMFVSERLFRFPQGYLGITQLGGGGSTLTRYNNTLGDARTIVHTDLVPFDFTLTSGGRGILLASHLGRAALYHLRLDSIPEASPLWEGTLPPLERIIALGDFDRDGRDEVAMVGDSAFSVVGLDGRERFTHRGTHLDAVLSPGDSTRFIVVTRSGASIYVSSLDPHKGSVVAMQEMQSFGEIIMSLMETAGGNVLAVATLGEAPTAYLFDPVSLGTPDILPLGGSPVALFSHGNGDGLLPAALFSTYPAPSVLPLIEGSERSTIDYPFASVVGGASVQGRYILLLSPDSIALYDRSLKLLGMLPSVGTTDASVMLIDSSKLLVSSASGSRVVVLPSTELTWVERHWPLLLFSAAGGVLIGSALAASRRYRFVRTVYNNLVRVPSSQGVIVTSSAQRVRQINQSARELLEIASYIPLGRHITEYLVAEELRPMLGALRKLFADGEEFEQRIDIDRNGSLRALTFRGRTLVGRYGYRAGYLILIEDITQTLERERLVNWASVAHHIAHEMKTPLSTVMMTAELLHDRLNNNGTEGEYTRATGRIMKQSSRLREIVEDLMTVARTEQLQKVSIDLALLISSLVHDFNESIPGNIQLRLEINGSDFRCMADASQLVVALRNLLDNAAQAIGSREGGMINVTIREGGGDLSITIEDNGVGMSKSTLAKLFQPFYTEREGGSGIGTVIIKRVIEGHGGTIEVESERGTGTTFVVTLPRH